MNGGTSIQIPNGIYITGGDIISDVINFPIGADQVIEKLERSILSNGKRDDKKYTTYCTALTKLKLLEKEGAVSLEYDKPDESREFHSIIIKFIKDSFDSESEIKNLLSSLEGFDGLMMDADSKGNIKFVLIKDKIYE